MSRIYNHYEQLEQPRKPCVITIGSFDGLHKGHQLLLDQVRHISTTKGLQSAALTFQPHPAKLLAPRLSPPLLMSYHRKEEGLLSFGLDFVLNQTFDTKFAMLSAEDFVHAILLDNLQTSQVVVGDDFTFGRERRGLANDLVKLGKKYKFNVEVIRRLRVEGMTVSSTRIRSFLLQGRVRAAALLLGRPYIIEGSVVRGDGRGHTLGYPTANLQSDAELLPSNGVYATYAWLESTQDTLLGVTNIGTRPTFGENQLNVEVHLLDINPELVGNRLIIGFIERLRPERAFESTKALVEQIDRDICETRSIDSSLGHRQPLLKIDGNLIGTCLKTHISKPRKL